MLNTLYWKKYLSIFGVLVFCVFLNYILWFSVRETQQNWPNVPPPPKIEHASASSLGDKQFAYRSIGLMLQNLGDSAGVSRPLMDYNYELLARWFYIVDYLDPRSNFAPYIASYYYGSVQTPESLPPLLEYLADVGSRADSDKWRFLVQAIHLARYRLEDLPLALSYAERLTALEGQGVELPIWARNMDNMILNVKGEKEAAYQIMVQTLLTERENMERTEYLFYLDYICYQILDEPERLSNPLCEEIIAQ
ncbi:MAG: hypothetical protein ACK4VI_02355 [Alphaproteobacteria bacterium]